MKCQALLLTLLLSTGLCFSQNGAYPGCDDLAVTHLQFKGRDSLAVTIHNNCLNCSQHVYTGVLIIDHQGDTIAAQKYLFSWSSPPNQASFTYDLDVFQPFTLADIQRVEMVGHGLCAQISFATLIDQAGGFVLAPNPTNNHTTIRFTTPLSVKHMALVDEAGRVVRVLAANTTHLNTTGLNAGTYFLRLTTTQSVVTKKLIVN